MLFKQPLFKRDKKNVFLCIIKEMTNKEVIMPLGKRCDWLGTTKGTKRLPKIKENWFPTEKVTLKIGCVIIIESL